MPFRIIPLFLLAFAQHGYGLSLKDALKETLKQAVEQQGGMKAQHGEPAESGLSQSEETVRSKNATVSSFGIQANPDDELMKQGMWRDAKTGLVWFRCHAGQTWTGAACEGGKLFETVDQAMLSVSQLAVVGHNDWRLPTLDEMETIRHCDNKRGFVTEYGHVDYQAQDGSIKRSFGVCKDGQPEIGTEEIFPEVGYSFWMLDSLPGQGVLMKQNAVMYIGSDASPARAMAVRGGQPSASYGQRLAQVRSKFGQKVALEKAAVQAKQQQTAEYERQTKELRKRVKPGDRIYQGLVLAVNGDLVKVQTYARECASYRTVRNPYSGQFDCDRYETVASGEKWVRRDEVRPIAKATTN